MTVAQKLAYLIRIGAITIDRVAPQYRDEVEALLGQAT